MQKLDIKKIILIDDDAAAHTYHKLMMSKAGLLNEHVQVNEYFSIKDATLALTNEANQQIIAPDIILLDINMPDNSGWDFLEKFSKIPFVGRIPFVYVVTNSDNPANVNRIDSYEFVIAIKKKFLSKEFFRDLVDGNLPV